MLSPLTSDTIRGNKKSAENAGVKRTFSAENTGGEIRLIGLIGPIGIICRERGLFHHYRNSLISDTNDMDAGLDPYPC